MNIILTSFLFGIFGGMIRASTLFLELWKLKRWSKWGMIVTGITLLAAGGLGGIIFDISWIFSLLGGYAAMDLLGSISKAFKKKKIKIE
ncbi:MAG: hypothetical protein KJ559_02200 [Nanoarchaeota archaeon]|nr:hypothetical protein [Nanoarchaeota archaeon]